MSNVALSFLTDKQARQLFKEELEQFFLNNPTSIKQEQPTSKVVDLDGLLKERPFIGSRSTIYKKVSKGEIPHSKSGKRLIFDLNIIDNWLLSNQIKTPAAIQAEAEQYVNSRNKKRRLKGLRRK